MVIDDGGFCLLTEAEARARNGSSLDSGNGVFGSEFGSDEPRVNSGGGATGLDLTSLLGSGGRGGGADEKLTALKLFSNPSSGSEVRSTSGVISSWLLRPFARVGGNAGTGGGGLLGGAPVVIGTCILPLSSGSSSLEMSRRLVAECIVFLVEVRNIDISSFLLNFESLKSFRLELDKAL